MNRKNILAHRGCWDDVGQQNSYDALKKAMLAGFGIETDFRDCSGAIVISHDPPKVDALKAKTFFELYTELGATGRIAINIKSDGLQKLLLTLLSETGVPRGNYYAFDMAVPDALEYINHDFPAYTRLSEHEEEAPFVNLAAGVWVDNFSGNFAQVEKAKEIMEAGTSACIVSSELHNRDHRALWGEIAAAGLHENPLFELCTDLPFLADNFFKIKQS